jgi:outer membrane protein OmpA-like peptidoglycan-associated protein
MINKTLFGALAALALGGCATQDFVRETVAPVQTQVTGLQQRVQTTDDGVKALDTRMKRGEERIQALQDEAKARAAAAGKVREPSFLMSTLLTDDKIKFAHGKALLSAEAGSELDQLLARLKSDNLPVFVEIQGHTDTTGSEALNQRLGLQRAEAVRQHLARAGMPLHRVATISYGASAPMADNRSAEGRQLNRRVQVVVLR